MQEILYSEIFIRKLFEHADPLEFLHLKTGFTQVKYNLLNSWPITSEDLENDSDQTDFI